VRGLSWPQVVLPALCLGFLVVIGAELTPGEPEADTGAAAARSLEQAKAGEAPRFVMPPVSDFARVLERPLFSQTRRPGPQAGTLPLSASFKLIAIVISGGDKHALLGSGQPLKVVRVTEGEEIGGWTVETIRPNAVVVRRADLREEVKPTDSKKLVAGKPPPVAAPPTAFVVSGSERNAVAPHKSHDE
jgi:hypothetical protein